jgi:hypothetical protein
VVASSKLLAAEVKKLNEDDKQNAAMVERYRANHQTGVVNLLKSALEVIEKYDLLCVRILLGLEPKDKEFQDLMGKPK